MIKKASLNLVWILGLSTLGMALPRAGHAATFTVTDCGDDDGKGQLRTLVKSASDGDTVQFNLDCTIFLRKTNTGENNNAGGDIDITNKGLTIQGNGAAKTVIDGQSTDRVFDIINNSGSAVTVTLKNLTIQNGSYVPPLQDFNFVNLNPPDPSTMGGGIRWGTGTGTLQMDSAVLSGNVSTGEDGGGIYLGDGVDFDIRASVFQGNLAKNNGGALFIATQSNIAAASIRKISGCTFKNNGATDSGGAIYNTLGSVSLVSSTVSGNFADRGGGGIYVGGQDGDHKGVVSLYNDTLTANVADHDGDGAGSGGGVKVSYYGSLNLQNTILSGNFKKRGSINNDCSGSLSSSNFNLIGLVDSDDCSFDGDGAGTADLFSPDVNAPKSASLGPLQDNGGPTETHALLDGSLAIDRGNNIVGCLDETGNPLTTDQRGSGFIRPEKAGGRCDIGAAENLCAGKTIDDGNVCTTDSCDQAGKVTHTPDAGPSCDDRDSCTTGDTCDANGKCAGKPMVCEDGDLCNGVSTCQNGACVQTKAPVTCASPDQCHQAGSCHPGSGSCDYPLKAPGSRCEDGDACTQTDTCDSSGVCQGSNPVVCTAPDPCHDAGVCVSVSSPETWYCTNPPKPDGTPIEDDGKPCTDNICKNGRLYPFTAFGTVVCRKGSGDLCNPDEYCSGASANCPEDKVLSDNSPCDDGTVCDGHETCQNGRCKAGIALSCNDGNACTTDSCDAVKGCMSSNPMAGCCNTDAECIDQNACTNDRCIYNRCVSALKSGADCQSGDDCNPSTCTWRAASCALDCPAALTSGDPAVCSLQVHYAGQVNGIGCSANGIALTEKRGQSGQYHLSSVLEDTTIRCQGNALSSSVAQTFTCEGTIKVKAREIPEVGKPAGKIVPQKPASPPDIYICRGGENWAFNYKTGEDWIDLGKPCEHLPIDMATASFEFDLYSNVSEFIRQGDKGILQEKVQPAIDRLLGDVFAGRTMHPVYDITLPQLSDKNNTASVGIKEILDSKTIQDKISGNFDTSTHETSKLLVVVDGGQTTGGAGHALGCSLIPEN